MAAWQCVDRLLSLRQQPMNVRFAAFRTAACGSAASSVNVSVIDADGTASVTRARRRIAQHFEIAIVDALATVRFHTPLARCACRCTARDVLGSRAAAGPGDALPHEDQHRQLLGWLISKPCCEIDGRSRPQLLARGALEGVDVAR